MAFSFAIAVMIASCSRKKTESPAHHDKENITATDTPTSIATEIKVFENVDASVKAQISNLFANYFALNNSFIEDNNDAAKAQAKTFLDTFEKFDMSKLVGDQMNFYHVQLAKITTSLKSISESVDIEESRTQLSIVSEGMYALVKAYHSNEAELYYQFCPMAMNHEGAYWISETKQILNPYMGQRMLTCGVTKEKL